MFVLPAGALIAVPADLERVYRLVMNSPPDERDFRYGNPRFEVEIERLGFSVYGSEDLADAWRKKPGSMIAELLLPYDSRCHLASTEPPASHMTLWGPIDMLIETVRIISDPLPSPNP